MTLSLAPVSLTALVVEGAEHYAREAEEVVRARLIWEVEMEANRDHRQSSLLACLRVPLPAAQEAQICSLRRIDTDRSLRPKAHPAPEVLAEAVGPWRVETLEQVEVVEEAQLWVLELVTVVKQKEHRLPCYCRSSLCRDDVALSMHPYVLRLMQCPYRNRHHSHLYAHRHEHP